MEGSTKKHSFKVLVASDEQAMCFYKPWNVRVRPPDYVAEGTETIPLLYTSSSSIKAVKELQCFMFANKVAEEEKLPPNQSAIRPHILSVN